jgi:hypothetical protein
MKDSITIQPSRAWMELLQYKRPDLFICGKNYAIECLIAEAVGFPRPITPAEKSATSRKKPSTGARTQN